MTGIIAGYLRESAGDPSNDGEREGQRIDIRRLAEHDGLDPARITWYDDWGRSGSGRQKRRAFNRLREDIDAGNVSVIYARSVDRLTREGLNEGMAFVAFCRIKGVRVVVQREGELTIDPDTVSVWQMAAPFLTAAEESRLGRVRARSARATRLRNRAEHIAGCNLGDDCPEALHWDGVQPYGTLPGEDVQAVLDAFLEAGSYSGATLILNARGVTPRRGNHWESTSVIRVVKRAAKARRLGVKLPTRKHRGSPTLAVHTFARLIRCPHDGSYLTATKRTDRKGPAVGYFCRLGRTSASRCPRHGVLVTRHPDLTWQCPEGHVLRRYEVVGDHPSPWSVSEHVILTWARDALGTAFFRDELKVRQPDIARDVTALREKRTRLGQVFVDEVIDEVTYRAALAGLDAELARLNGIERASVTFRLGIDWSLPARELNEGLRDLLYSIQLDDRMRPVGAVWLREPTLPHPDDEESVVPNPAAHPVTGGWYLPARVTEEGSKAGSQPRARRAKRSSRRRAGSCA
ncbi:MAG TPA: recombinase family protein [Candidatus Limnocylindrales bacterium]|nr:recombinase family protein [Candidatus Limnocylindrales bacterium]